MKDREKERERNKREEESGGPLKKKERKSLVFSIDPMIFNLFIKRSLKTLLEN